MWSPRQPSGLALLSQVSAAEAADKLFARLDMNGDGVVDPAEWAAVKRMLAQDRHHILKMPQGPARERALATLVMQDSPRVCCPS